MIEGEKLSMRRLADGLNLDASVTAIRVTTFRSLGLEDYAVLLKAAVLGLRCAAAKAEELAGSQITE